MSTRSKSRFGRALTPAPSPAAPAGFDLSLGQEPAPRVLPYSAWFPLLGSSSVPRFWMKAPVAAARVATTLIA